MNCDEYLPLISGHLDGMNSEIEERHLQEHLKACESCRALLSEMEQNDALLKGSIAQPPVDLTDRIMRQVRKEKQSSRKHRWIPIAVSGVAAAALLSLVFLGNLPVLQSSKDTAAAEGCAPESAQGIEKQDTLSAALPLESAEANYSYNGAGVPSVTLDYEATYGTMVPGFPECNVASTEADTDKRSPVTRYTPSAPVLIVWNAECPDALDAFEASTLDEYTPLTANPVPSLYARYQTIVPLIRDFDLLSPDDGYAIKVYTVPYETMMAVFNETAGVYENAIYYPALFTAPDACSVILINYE
ncbi:MAG: zf-HC2 domain-containing protein [Oscillospiraceae bacterium]|nr:zf-HC2 domain-containing protein [Oscillospiraceae bacterium]